MNREDELLSLQNNIVNRALIIGYTFGVLSYLVTLSRAFEYGFSVAFTIITIVMIALGGVVWFRKKLSLKIKIYSVMVVVLAAMVTGLSKFGFLVSSKAYVIFIPVLISFVFSYRKAFAVMLLYGLVYGSFGFLYVSGIREFTVDANEYVLSVNAWLMDLSIILLTGFALLYVSKMYLDTILEKLSVIKDKNDDLSLREQRYRYLFELSFDAILIIKGNEIIDVNERALGLFDCQRIDIVGKSILALSTEYQDNGLTSKAWGEELLKDVESGIARFFEWQYTKKNGEVFLASVSLALVNNGDVEFYQALIKDITEQKKQQQELDKYRSHLEGLVQLRTEELEQANEEMTRSNNSLIERKNELELTLNELHNTQEILIESEKMASMGFFAAGVAHEINNPLNFIQSGLYSLQNVACGQYDDIPKIEFEEMKAEIVMGMGEGVNRINDIVESLERFNKKSEKYFSSCNIRVIIDGCLNILAFETTARIEVERYYPDEEMVVNGNEGELHQVFLNLLYNSVQAISDKGKIIVTIEKLEDVDMVKITISDNGVGMGDEVMSRIFEPFYTTKEVGAGIGLGLSTVYNIINKHGGDIKVDSKLGIGSEFSVLVPLKS